MDTNKLWLVSGMAIGIIFIWFGILIAISSLPLARGKGHAREYNGQLWQPKFIRTMTDEEHDKISRKNAKWKIAFSLFMIAVGFSVIIIGALSIANPIIIAWIISIILLIMVPAAYGLMFLSWRKTHKADKK